MENPFEQMEMFFMEKTVKRVSIWKPWALSIVLILTTQQKIYAEDPDEPDLSNLSTTEIVLTLGVILALGALIVTTVAVEEAGNKKSGDDSASGSTGTTATRMLSPVQAGSTLSDSNSECNRLQKQASDIRFQCQINGKSASDCENDMVYVVAKKQADDTCYYSK